MDNQNAWKTKSGFDILNKKDNYNQHPKKPHPSKQDELLIPYQWQKEVTDQLLEKKEYRPEDDGKPGFIQKVKGVTTFSDNKFFKTVFVSGDDMVAEENALKQAELEDWNSKVIVADKHFAVNTKPMGS